MVIVDEQSQMHTRLSLAGQSKGTTAALAEICVTRLRRRQVNQITQRKGCRR